MKVPKELIDQWWVEWHSEGRIQPVLEYIAQRAAEWALSQSVSMEPVTYTSGHCKEKAKVGGCQLHNLQCGYPKCDRKSALETKQEQSNGRRNELRSDLYSDISERGCSDNSVADKTLLPVSMEPVAWLRNDGMRSMPDDEKEAWIHSLQPKLVEDYTEPLYTQSQLAAARQQGAEEERSYWKEFAIKASKRIAELEDIAYALEAILQRAGESATVGSVIAIVEQAHQIASIAEVKP